MQAAHDTAIVGRPAIADPGLQQVRGVTTRLQPWGPGLRVPRQPHSTRGRRGDPLRASPSNTHFYSPIMSLGGRQGDK